MPKHNEPDKCEVWSCQMYGYSGLHYLLRIAAHIDLTGELPSPGGDGAAHDDVLKHYYKHREEQDPGFPVRLLNPLQKYNFSFDHLIIHNDDDGFYIPIEFDKVIHPDLDLDMTGGLVGSSIKLLQECKRLASVLEIPPHLDENSDELYKAADSQGEGITRWQRYGVESFSCVRLIKACQKSIETSAAMVFT